MILSILEFSMIFSVSCNYDLSYMMLHYTPSSKFKIIKIKTKNKIKIRK